MMADADSNSIPATTMKPEQVLLQAFAATQSSLPPDDPGLTAPLQRLAKWYYDHRKYAHALPRLEQLLRIYTKTLGETHELTIETLHRLAVSRKALGDHAEAVDLLQRLRTSLEKSGPLQKLQLIDTLNHLVELVFEQGQLDEADRLCQQVRELLGTDIRSSDPRMQRMSNNLAALHVARREYFMAERLLRMNLQLQLGRAESTREELAYATTLNNLAEVCRLQGRPGEADKFTTKALKVRTRLLGENHGMVVQSLSNLGTIRFESGRVASAEALFRRVLAIRLEPKGGTPLDIACTQRNLAEILCVRGKSDEATTLLEQAVVAFEQTLGSANLQVAVTLALLGHVHLAAGRPGNAMLALNRALAIKEEQLPPHDPLLVGTLNGLGCIYSVRGDYDRAENFHRRALMIQENAQGREHLDVARTLCLLAHLHQQRGNFPEAEIAYQRALTIRERIWGPKHTAVAEMKALLARLFVAEEQYAHAAGLCSQILTSELAYGEYSAEFTLDTLTTFTDACLGLKHFAYAEQLARLELNGRIRLVGEGHAGLMNVQFRLAEACEALGQTAEAELLLQDCLKITDKTRAQNTPLAAACADRLACLHLAHGDYEKAQPLMQRAIKFAERTHGAKSGKLADLLERYAALLRTAQRVDEAIVFESRATAVRDQNEHVLCELMN